MGVERLGVDLNKVTIEMNLAFQHFLPLGELDSVFLGPG
jgi:hypothetical protein